MIPRLHIALVHPEIGPNAGNIGRLCLGIGARLHLVHPLGFSTDDKAVRRAGLDYWKHVDVVEHKDLATFQDWSEGRRTFMYSTKGAKAYTHAQHEPGDVLMFGRESRGLPAELLAGGGALNIPMAGPTRSLNLSNAVAVVAYGALQQVAPALFGGGENV